MVDITGSDRFVLHQRFKLVINQYEFSVPDGNVEGNDGTPFCFVEQARFKFKEDIRFFTDDSKSEEIMRIRAKQRFDPRATYDITLPDGTKLGQIKKVFGKSLLRSTYAILGPNGDELTIAREKSMGKAIFRRLVGFIPYVGGFADWLPIAYDFEFLHGEERIGLNSRRRFKWRDIYDIDFTADPERRVDRRLVLAATVGMDALQAR
jgi:uncharacterized protein YxjI